jgi:hypothetical protein
MTKTDLPNKRVFSNAFKEKGRTDVVKIEVFPVRNGDQLILTFESKESPCRQGVWLKSDGSLTVNKMQSPSLQIWEDTAPRQVLLNCHTTDGRIHLYNIWDRGGGYESQTWTSGMLVEEIANGRRYRCNDIGLETNFNKLVFRLERVARGE